MNRIAQISLVNVTPHALETLIFTKNTRLRMTARGLQEIIAWPDEKKKQELEYMKGTIQSSWEFVDYIFMIEGVTRAFTHQLVRHRVGTSFAQQAQRAVDMTNFDHIPGPSIARSPVLVECWDDLMRAISDAYEQMVEDGANRQDARGVLPTNISTNICFKANLRTLHDMGRKRLCVKAQGEFQDVFRAIKAAVVEVHPWADDMIQVECGWNGTCIFPSYPVEDCPVKPHVYNPHTAMAYGAHIPESGVHPWPLVQIRALHASVRAEAQPVVVED